MSTDPQHLVKISSVHSDNFWLQGQLLKRKKETLFYKTETLGHFARPGGLIK